jgi:glycosyltransferase involved in cell wall biosynthesis
MDTLSKGMERRIVTEPWYKKWFYRNESKRLARYERSVFDYFEFKTIISKQDRNYLIHPKKDQVHVIPNGVDASFFEELSLKKDKDIVFTGNFSYPPNIEAAVFLAEELLPALHKRGLMVNLLLSGASPTERVKELANEFVEVSGWIHDIRFSYQRAKLFVAPMFIGTGLQNKLLEAMASGLPCVTTSLANNALGGTGGENILLAENSIDFVEICADFFQNSASFKAVASDGRRYVELNYTWNKQNQLLIHLLQSASVS